MRRLSTVSAILAASLMVLGLHADQCRGQIVPYDLVGSGVADPLGGDAGLGSFYGPAIAAHMGRLTYFAEAVTLDLVFDDEGNLIGFDYYAIDTQVAADGSEVYLDGAGSATLIPRDDLGPTIFEAVWDGDWNILGGSGRFENVGPGTAPIDLFVFFFAFDITDNETLRPFVYTKMGDWDLGRRN